MNLVFGVNYVGVIAATIAVMILGFVWYSPPLFGRRWLGYLGKTQAELGRPGPAFAIAIVAAFLNSWVLAVLAKTLGANNFDQGLVVGVVAWLGFQATLTAAGNVFEQRPWGLWVLNNAHNLLGQMLIGAIVTLLR